MNKTLHHPDFLVAMKRVEAFLRDHYPGWVKEDGFDQLCDYFAWFWNRHTMIVSVDRLGEIDTVCLVKLFRYLNQFDEKAVHDPCGQFCMIKFLVSVSRRGHANAIARFIKRWGKQQFVFWDRGERTLLAPRLYSWQDFEKLARRFTKERIN
jgi:hypothetical protein